MYQVTILATVDHSVYVHTCVPTFSSWQDAEIFAESRIKHPECDQHQLYVIERVQS